MQLHYTLYEFDSNENIHNCIFGVSKWGILEKNIYDYTLEVIKVI